MKHKLVSGIIGRAYRLLLSYGIVSDAYTIDGYQCLFLNCVLTRQFVPLKTLPLQVFRGGFQAHECYQLLFTTNLLQVTS
ncbi:MAG: hypothetical protein JSW59_04290 [Phycisphaerales bacterium]|nr:MAG: hypothetical protein JSW59_04290 [Phycisphaerales bacterium]